MAFYTVDLKQECQHPHCPKDASKEVRASGTLVYGAYCAKHATQRVRELEQAWEGQQPR